MKLLKNTWYKVKFEDSDCFIKDLIDTLQVIDTNIVYNNNAIILLCSGAVDHLYIKYNIVNDKISINYRTNYNDLYMNKMNEYKTTNKEENKMCCEKESHKELLDMKYDEERKELENERIANRDLVINNTDIGKGALIYIKAIRTYTNVKPAPTIDQLVAYDMLPLEAREELDAINRRYEVKYAELNAKYKTINSLISLADTYEQKIDILTRYNIIELPKKPRK